MNQILYVNTILINPASVSSLLVRIEQGIVGVSVGGGEKGDSSGGRDLMIV
jgi:hypothetical protein